MGLDMYLRGEKFFWTDWEHPENNRMEHGLKINSLTVDLGYWRKHPNLHGFIVQTFASGVDECQKIWLEAKHLEELIQAVERKGLPHTEGFFFGHSDGTETEEDLAILRKAIEWLETKEAGVSRSVYYRASW